MTQSEQLVIERGAPEPPSGGLHGRPSAPIDGDRADARVELGERAARSSLRAQLAHLEHELSAIVADGFPFIPAPSPARRELVGPCLLSLGELERSRDRLAGRVSELRRRADDRAEHERRASELLEKMKLEPGRYKFARLPVRDLGQGGCGVWEVRPRLGLIGMLAGWWQVKLSSGCPLPRGPRPRRVPAESSGASPRACVAGGRSSSRRSSFLTSGSG